MPQVNGSTPSIITTSDGATTISSGHPNFDKVMKILDALIPVAVAATAPFIKSGSTQTIVASEEPIAQALLAALGTL